MIKHWPGTTWEGKGLFDSHVSITVNVWEVRAETQAGQEAGGRSWRTGHRRVLVTGLPPRLARPAFYSTQDNLPKGGTTHSGHITRTSVINQEKGPQACLQAHSTEAFLSWGSSFSRILASVELTKHQPAYPQNSKWTAMGNNKTNKFPPKIKARGWKGGYVVGMGRNWSGTGEPDAVIFPGVQGWNAQN